MSPRKSEPDNKIQEVLAAYDKSNLHPKFLPPLDRMIHAVLADAEDGLEAERGIGRIHEAFINWNDCRVARLPEIARVLDPLPGADKRAIRMRKMLNRLFDARGAMELSFLERMKATEAKRLLIDLDSGIPRDVVALILFEMVPGVTIPLSNEALKIARKHGLVGRSGTKQQLQKALAADATPTEAARLVHYLELEAHGVGSTTKKASKKPGKSTSKASKTTAKKAAKKTSKKS